MAANAKADSVETKDYVVAPGKTVVTDDGDKGPGDTVTLPVDEGQRLQSLGFLRSDDGAVIANTATPPATAGVEIKEQA